MPWSIIIVGVFFAAFGLLARLWPCNPGQNRFFNSGMIDDALYWALGIILYGDITLILIKLAVGGDAVTLKAVATGYGRAAALPVWAQRPAIFILTYVLQYWIHRLL